MRVMGRSEEHLSDRLLIGTVVMQSLAAPTSRRMRASTIAAR